MLLIQIQTGANHPLGTLSQRFTLLNVLHGYARSRLHTQ